MKQFGVVLLLAGLAACSKQEVPSETPPADASAAANTAIGVPAGAYALDKTHASLSFRVDHLGFSNYTARFKEFDAHLQLDPSALERSSVNVTVDVNSLDLDRPPEGFLAELLGPNWLDAERFPTITYRSTSVEPTGPNSLRITGDLTMHGVTRPVVLDASFNGGYAGHPMDPNARVGFSARGTLNRSEFGIAAGVPEPGSKMGVSDAVEVIVEAEFNGPPWQGEAGNSQT